MLVAALPSDVADKVRQHYEYYGLDAQKMTDEEKLLELNRITNLVNEQRVECKAEVAPQEDAISLSFERAIDGLLPPSDTEPDSSLASVSPIMDDPQTEMYPKLTNECLEAFGETGAAGNKSQTMPETSRSHTPRRNFTENSLEYEIRPRPSKTKLQRMKKYFHKKIKL